MASPSLAKLGKMLQADVARGEIGLASLLAIEELSSHPELAIAIIDSLIPDACKTVPNEDAVATGVLMLGTVLEGIRYGVEAGRREANSLAQEVRRHLIAAEASGRMKPALMLLILNQFVDAKLDVGDELQAVMLRMIEDDAATAPAAALREGAEGLQQLARAFDGNPFDIHGHWKELAEALPEVAQVKLALSLLTEAEDGLAQAALGFLLSPSAEVRKEVGRALAKAAGTAAAAGKPDAPILLRRLITLRNWLPAPERPSVDAAIKGLRQKSVACATSAKPGKVEAYATGFDGSGMQSVFLIVKEGRKHAIVALIGRLGRGVRDAYVRHGASKREVEAVLRSGDQMGGLAPVELDYVAAALRQFLAGNAQSASLPPFGLLAVAECAGLAELAPELVAVGNVVERICTEIEPDYLAPDWVGKVLAESADWHEQYALLQSWFQEGDEVSGLLKEKRLGKSKKIALILAGPIESHRHRWAETLAWMAMFTKAITDADTPWREFVIVARELLSDRPIGEIGLARSIAEQTLEAYVDSIRP